MKDINGRRITLEALKDELRQKSKSALLEEMEVVMARRFPNPDLIFAYSDVLNEKDPVDPPFDATASLEKLHARIKIVEGSEPEKVAPPKKGRTYWRILRAVPGVVVLLLALVIFGQASGVFRFFDHGDGTFSISAESGQMELPSEVEAEFHSLQEALNYYGVDGPVAVQWIPNEFSLESVKAYLVDGLTMISAMYVAEGDRTINIRIFDSQLYAGRNEGNDVKTVEEYPVGDVTFYISDNFEQYMAFWESGIYEYRMGGDISKEELKMMIQSIFKESDLAYEIS